MKSTPLAKKRCWRCKHADGAHREGCPAAVCKLCQRVAPDKCRRHGGPSHSTAFRGRAGGKASGRARREPRPIRKLSAPAGTGTCGSCHRAGGTHTVLCRRGSKVRSTLVSEIRRLKGIVARGRDAQRELNRIRKALDVAKGV